MQPITEEAFRLLVAEALDALPEWVQRRLDNVAVLTADWPTPEQRQKSGIAPGQLLLGLYEGVPTTRRGRGYTMLPPDRVTLYRGSMLTVARSRTELVTLVQRTLLHELGHHLGFGEDDLKRLDL
jgi:predicted Zn-dependent protease with MMP-like domain